MKNIMWIGYLFASLPLLVLIWVPLDHCKWKIYLTIAGLGLATGVVIAFNYAEPACPTAQISYLKGEINVWQ